jgi:hypothetical protein
MLDYVRADRIEFYVTQDAPHPVLLDRTGKESVLPEMTMSAVLHIVPAGVIVVHAAYSQGERVLQTRDYRKVGVVGHQVVSD